MGFLCQRSMFAVPKTSVLEDCVRVTDISRVELLRPHATELTSTSTETGQAASIAGHSVAETLERSGSLLRS